MTLIPVVPYRYSGSGGHGQEPQTHRVNPEHRHAVSTSKFRPGGELVQQTRTVLDVFDDTRTKTSVNIWPNINTFLGIDEDSNDTIYEMDAMIFTASQEKIHSS